MRNRQRLKLVMACGASLLTTSPTLAGEPSQPIDLLAHDLSAWFRWIGVPYPGLEHLPAGAPVGDGMAGVPLGLDGYPGVFELHSANGEPVLRVSGELYGALTTKASYGDYHLRLEYRWGETKWPPRRPDQPRDSGLLIHLTGSLDDAHWSVFLMGLESQISEGRTGDLLFMSNKDDTVIPTVVARTGDGKHWNPRQSWRTIGGRGADPIFVHAGDHETPRGGWTTVDIYTSGDSGVSLVNGSVAMAWKAAQVILSDGTGRPLTQGRIQLQSEGAEVFYRRVMLTPIEEIPEDVQKNAGLTPP